MMHGGQVSECDRLQIWTLTESHYTHNMHMCMHIVHAHVRMHMHMSM